jgi:hypothetical protein
LVGRRSTDGPKNDKVTIGIIVDLLLLLLPDSKTNVLVLPMKEELSMANFKALALWAGSIL